MELRHLRYFYEVAEEMNFTRAAEKLNIAQPPLSKQIKDLEEELGVDLFVRRPHFLALTPEGEMLKQYAVQILGLADKAVETIKEMGQGLNGTISVATVEGHILRSLSMWITEFGKEHPSIQYNIWTGGADDIIGRIKNGLCDFAIIADPKDSDGMQIYPLYKESWTALIPIDSPLAQKKEDSISTSELLPYNLIIPTRTGRFEEVAGWFRDSDVKPKVRCRFTNLLAAYELTRQSFGITIYPGTMEEILSLNNDDSVVLKRIINPSNKANFVMVFNKNRILPNVVYEFMKFIRKQNRLKNETEGDAE